MTDQLRKKGARLADGERAEAKRLYETTELTQVEIGARVGVSGAAICKMAKAGGWVRQSKAQRAEAVLRIRSRVEREILAVEATLGQSGPLSEADRSARTLASLVRTLRDLQKYDEDCARRRREEAEDDDGPPADLDALRDALADRLEKLQRENQ